MSFSNSLNCQFLKEDKRRKLELETKNIDSENFKLLIKF